MQAFRAGGILFAVIIIAAILFSALFLVRIPNGYVGVIYSPNGGVKDTTLSQGWHVVGLFEKIRKYPIRLQTVEYKNIEVASKDGKKLTTKLAFNYQIEPTQVVPIFNTFGPISVSEIEESYLRTRLWDASRKEIAKTTVIEIFGEKSADASVAIQSRFADDIGKLGFVVTNLTLGVPEPDEETQKAINAKVNATQALEREKTELEITKVQADKKREEAQGEADATLTRAKAQSEANELLQRTITKELIQYEFVKNLPNVKLPAVMGSSGNILQLPSSILGDN